MTDILLNKINDIIVESGEAYDLFYIIKEFVETIDVKKPEHSLSTYENILHTLFSYLEIVKLFNNYSTSQVKDKIKSDAEFDMNKLNIIYHQTFKAINKKLDEINAKYEKMFDEYHAEMESEFGFGGVA